MYLVLKKTPLKKAVDMPHMGITDPIFDENRKMWGKTWASFGLKDNSKLIKDFLAQYPDAASKIWDIVGKRLIRERPETLTGDHWKSIRSAIAGQRTSDLSGAHNIGKDLVENIAAALAHWRSSDAQSNPEAEPDWAAAEKLADYQLAVQPKNIERVNSGQNGDVGQHDEFITHLFPNLLPNGFHEYRVGNTAYWSPKISAAQKVHKEIVGQTFQQGNLRPGESSSAGVTPPKVGKDFSTQPEDVVAFPSQESFDNFNWHIMNKINSLAVNLSSAGVSDRDLEKTLKTHAKDEVVKYMRAHWGKTMGGPRGDVVKLRKEHYGWNTAAELAHQNLPQINPTLQHEVIE